MRRYFFVKHLFCQAFMLCGRIAGFLVSAGLWKSAVFCMRSGCEMGKKITGSGCPPSRLRRIQHANSPKNISIGIIKNGKMKLNIKVGIITTMRTILKSIVASYDSRSFFFKYFRKSLSKIASWPSLQSFKSSLKKCVNIITSDFFNEVRPFS